MLKIEHLTLQKHRKVILSDVNLEVKEGAFVLLCGSLNNANAAVMECIAGLCDYQKGRIRWKNQRLKKADMFYASQATCLFKEHTIKEYGEFLSQFYPTFSLEDYSNLIQACGLHGKQRIFFLQDEEKQLVEVIAAFSTHCALLLLDRVLTSFSLKKQEQLWTKLLQIGKPTIVAAMDDTSVLKSFANEIYVVQDETLMEKAQADVMLDQVEITESNEEAEPEVRQNTVAGADNERLFNEKGWDEDETDW